VLRPVLEAALAVAREGEEDTPAVQAPAPLRPFLRFAKLPPRALAATRKALDADGEFRGRVVEVAKESDVGRAGWLFLTRPDGWQDELAGLVEGAEESAREQADRRAERDARHRLAAVQQAAQKAEAAAVAARGEAAEAASVLVEARRARQAAMDEAAAASRRADELSAERDRLRAALSTLKAEAESLRRRLAEADAERVELRATVAAASAVVPVAPPPVPIPPPGPPVGVVELGDAADAAARLADALRAAVAALGAPVDQSEPEPASPPPAQVQAGVRRAVRRAERPEPRRRPAPLPPAVFDDSVDAAAHLVRVPDVVLLIDGYNVSQSGWPGLGIAEQRRRLVDALAELSARTGAEPRVVFDGAELAMPGVVPTTGQAVRVTFSPPGVEADDVVIEMAGQLPLHRPLVVVSSDKRVQAGARQAGANVISTEQLLAVLGR
jgi:predicted RNA-binding protein with PIN domain